MKTLTQENFDRRNAVQSVQATPIARRMGRAAWLFLLRGIGGVVVTLALAPVVLLPLATSVPPALWLLLALADIGLLLFLIARAESWAAHLAAMGGVIAVAVLAVYSSQWFASTPPILGADGKPLPGSIATLEKVALNGSEQWITIRGKDIDNPVLLFLAGGPGGSQLTTARHALAELEDHFVVVNWEQPGAGKSFNAVDRSTLTPERYIQDGHALVRYLRQRFAQEKVYVMGESWGSALGVMLAQRYPDDFHAFIGAAQMVDFLETDLICYDFALQWAAERGEAPKVAQLRQQGPPPYYGKGVAWKQVAYLQDTYAYMNQDPAVISGFNTPRDLASPEYGLIDKVNWARGPLDTLGIVYPQLWDVDFREQAPRLDMPVFFLTGRHDVNAPPALIEEYYELLDAPHKELIWFEHSGHSPWVSESDKFVDVLVNRVLAQTASQPDAALQALGTVAETAAFFDRLLPAQLREHHIAGAAVAVVKEGALHFAQGYGYADLATEQPVAADGTLFRTDSSGKLFVWTAVMQLVERGELDLDADVNTYLDFSIPATYAQPITLRHLLSHSAGFEDQGYMFAHDAADLVAPGAFLAGHMPARMWPPGQVSGYSNYGTALAGYIVERVAGMPFEQYVEEQIFTPLAMAQSTFRQPVPAALEADVTQNYAYANGEFHRQPFTYLHVASAGEGHMTVIDMAKFMQAHLAEGDTSILTAATMARMHSRLFSHHPDANGFAYGFAESTLNGLRVLRHEGNNPGVSSSALFLIPEHQMGVYVAYNSNGGFVPGEQLRSAFLNHYYPAPPAPPTPAALSAEERAQLAGSYRTTRLYHTTFGKLVRLLGSGFGANDIIVRPNADGTFTTHGLGTSAQQWVAVAPDRLRLAGGTLDSYGDLLFAAGEAGDVATLFVENNPYRAYEKAVWTESVSLHRWLLGLCLGVLGSLLLATPVYWLVQRRRPGATFLHGSAPAWYLLLGACGLVILFGVGFALTAVESLLYGPTPGLVAALALPLLALGLAVASLLVTLFTWRRTRWGAVRLAHYAVGLVAMGGLGAWLNYWQLLGWRL